MKKHLWVFLGIVLGIPTAFSANYFYEQQVGFWTVYGHPGNQESKLNPACIAQTTWKDGSYFLMISDLTDKELHLEFKNNEWDIQDKFGQEFELTLNVYTSNDSDVQSWKAYFWLVDKNTIKIRGLDPKTFLPAFMNYSRMKFIMPGTITNASVDLKNTTKVVGLLVDCIKVAEKGIPQQNQSDSLNSKMDM